MQTLFYPGVIHQPCQVEYGIALNRDPHGAGADIVVVDSRGAENTHTALIHSPPGVQWVLNKILTLDLAGIRLDRIRFFLIAHAESPVNVRGYEYPIKLDLAEFQRNGHPVTVREVRPTSLKGWLRFGLGFYVKTATILNGDARAGSAMANADLEKARALTDPELSALLAAVGYDGPARNFGMPSPPDKPRPPPPSNVVPLKRLH